MIISPSTLAIKAVGLQPVGDNICQDLGLGCTVCGVGIDIGQTYSKLDLPPSFTNHLALATPGGTYICGACRCVMETGAFQQALSTAIVCRDGLYPIMKKENRAWAFLTPPEPPFYVTVQNAQQQHVVWRAPVSLSKDVFLVRVGEQILRLRRQKLIEARAIVFRLDDFRREVSSSESHNATRGKGRKEKQDVLPDSVESPFVTDWKYQSVDAGTPKAWFLKLIESGAVTAEERRILFGLNAGEIWALQGVLHRHPVQPAPKTLDD